jgi:(p)ppGpp synthase/HD superfamily hydrolase
MRHHRPVSSIVEHARAFIAAAYGGASAKKLAHAQEVGELLAELGCVDEVVAAGYLHDVVEDTDTDVTAVRDAFGDPIADLVAALTEDPSITAYAARKDALRASIAQAGPAALTITAADKLARVRAADRAGKRLAARKLRHYEQTLAMLEQHGIRTAHTAELGRRLHERQLAAAR